MLVQRIIGGTPIIKIIIIFLLCVFLTACGNTAKDNAPFAPGITASPPIVTGNQNIIPILRNMTDIEAVLGNGFYRVSLPDAFDDEYKNSVALFAFAALSLEDGAEEWYNGYHVSKDVNGEYNDFYRSLFGKSSTFPYLSFGRAAGIATTDEYYDVGLGGFSGGNEVEILETNGNRLVVTQWRGNGPDIENGDNVYASKEEMIADSKNLQKWEIVFIQTENGYIIENIVKQ